MSIVPVLVFVAPNADALVPPMQLPVMFKTPVDILDAAGAEFPVQEPVKFRTPVDELAAAIVAKPEPPMQSPVTFKVPVEKF
jgi:hypothetical protein